MRIGELAELSGVSVQTIRYYEKQGLIAPALRLQNNYRSYGKDHLTRLRMIRHCRTLDMPLEDIATLLELHADNAKEASNAHELLHRRLVCVRERIADLKELESHLIALEHRCSGHHAQAPCGILQGLNEDADLGVCQCGHRHEEHAS